MPITVQQFDFLAETQGIAAALRIAEESGGVTGTRDAPIHIELEIIWSKRYRNINMILSRLWEQT